jgi:hypothetical protein
MCALLQDWLACCLAIPFKCLMPAGCIMWWSSCCHNRTTRIAPNVWCQQVVNCGDQAFCIIVRHALRRTACIHVPSFLTERSRSFLFVIDTLCLWLSSMNNAWLILPLSWNSLLLGWPEPYKYTVYYRIFEYLVISLPKIPYIQIYTVHIWFWPTLFTPLLKSTGAWGEARGAHFRHWCVGTRKLWVTQMHIVFGGISRPCSLLVVFHHAPYSKVFSL